MAAQQHTPRPRRVAVFGQGYVGLSVACAAATAGYDVVGIDTDDARIASLADGDLAVPGVRADEFDSAVATRRLSFTTDGARCNDADIVLICVPTPILERLPDLSMVAAAGRTVAEHMKPGALVVLESTTYAGTTEDLLAPILEAGHRRAGTDFLLAFAPERIDPGNTSFAFHQIPRVVGGIDQASTDAAVAFYADLVDRVHPVSSTRAAEQAKLLENTFRMVNIAMVNEFAMLCADQGINPWEVIEAADTKPFGFMPFYPGPGVGGHCIPIDPIYLTWQSRRDAGRPIRLVELAQDINAEMPGWVIDRIAEALNDQAKAVRGSAVLTIGVTYKPDVGDLRESAAMQVLHGLARRGADISYHDPHVPTLTVGDHELESVELTVQAIAAADLVAVLTPHRAVDLDRVVANAGLVFDARNATGGGPNVVVL